jgi:hypothetical protein
VLKKGYFEGVFREKQAFWGGKVAKYGSQDY